MALQTGCTHLLDETVDPVATVESLAGNDCTHAGTGTPFYLMYLAAQQRRTDAGLGPLFPSLKVCPGGGAPIPPALHRNVQALYLQINARRKWLYVNLAGVTAVLAALAALYWGRLFP